MSDYTEDLAASMLASTLGIDFDVDSAWDEKEKVFKMSNKIVSTTNITQTAEGNKNGLWTSVVAVAFLFLKNLTNKLLIAFFTLCFS